MLRLSAPNQLCSHYALLFMTVNGLATVHALHDSAKIVLNSDHYPPIKHYCSQCTFLGGLLCNYHSWKFPVYHTDNPKLWVSKSPRASFSTLYYAPGVCHKYVSIL